MTANQAVKRPSLCEMMNTKCKVQLMERYHDGKSTTNSARNGPKLRTEQRRTKLKTMDRAKMNKDVPSKVVLFIVLGQILGTLVTYGNGVHQDCHEVRLDPVRELPCSTLPSVRQCSSGKSMEWDGMFGKQF